MSDPPRASLHGTGSIDTDAAAHQQGLKGGSSGDTVAGGRRRRAATTPAGETISLRAALDHTVAMAATCQDGVASIEQTIARMQVGVDKISCRRWRSLTVPASTASPTRTSCTPCGCPSGTCTTGRDRVLVIGPDRAGGLLEVVVIDPDDDPAVVHAMPLRRKFYDYLYMVTDDAENP